MSYYKDDEITVKTAKDAKLSEFKKALLKWRGNISKACMECNISRDTAHRWVKKNKTLKLYIDDLKERKRSGDFDDPDE